MADTTSTVAVRTIAGVTADTFRHLQLGPGALIRDFEYENITTPDEFKRAVEAALQNGQGLGGTIGGFNINVTPQMRRIEVDGANIPFKGDSVIDSWECYMETTLKEFTPDILGAAFPTSEFVSENQGITAMRIRTGISRGDYWKNACWIASTQYGFVMVAMHNALGRTTGSITSEDKGEGQIPYRVDGHIEDFNEIDFAPCEILFVDTVGGLERVNVGGSG